MNRAAGISFQCRNLSRVFWSRDSIVKFPDIRDMRKSVRAQNRKGWVESGKSPGVRDVSFESDVVSSFVCWTWKFLLINIIDKESVVFWKRTFQVPCCKERSKRSVIVLFLYSVQINKSWRRSLNSNSFYLREREQIENAWDMNTKSVIRPIVIGKLAVIIMIFQKQQFEHFPIFSDGGFANG